MIDDPQFQIPTNAGSFELVHVGKRFKAIEAVIRRVIFSERSVAFVINYRDANRKSPQPFFICMLGKRKRKFIHATTRIFYQLLLYCRAGIQYFLWRSLNL